MIAGISDAIVTGGTGFIGAALAHRLAREGVRDTCPVRAGSPRAARLAGVPGLTVVPVQSFDLTSMVAALGGIGGAAAPPVKRITFCVIT